MNMDTKRREDGVVVLSLEKRLDAPASPELKKAVRKLVDKGELNIVLDMERIAFVDSSGLGALVSSLKTVTAAGGDLRMAALIPEVRALIELTRLDKVFDIHETVDGAIAGFY